MPHGGAGLGAAAALLAATLLGAFLVTRMPRPRLARGVAWSLAALVVWAAESVTSGQPPGFRMLVVILGLLYAMKAVVSVEASAQEGGRLPPMRWLAFATLWPGMRPALFARHGPPRAGAWPLVRRGLLHIAGGTALVALARGIWSTTHARVPSTLALLPGLSLLLHFGLFDLAAGLWRLGGVDAGELFRAPLRAASLREFWGRRWNVAFSEMMALAVYRPLSGLAGRRSALAAAFLLSGLFHEAAISLPVRAGFGGPLAFFALHGLLTAVEHERGPLGRGATLAAVVLPLPLLFHPPFLRGVVWPLLGPAG